MKNKRAVYLVVSDSAGTEIKFDVSKYIIGLNKKNKLFIASTDNNVELKNDRSYVSFFKASLMILQMTGIDIIMKEE